MAVAQLRFACEKKTDEGWQRYDSIECLLADAGDGAAYLTDYDGGALHAADSMWVVKGSFPSPMGGGFAACATRGAADEVAAKTNGRVGRLEAFGGAR